MKSRLPASPFFGRICQAKLSLSGIHIICQGTQDSRLYHTHSQAYTHMRVYRCFFFWEGYLYLPSFPRPPSCSASVAVGNLFCMLIADKHLMRFIIKLEIVRHTHGMATSARSRAAEEQKEVPRFISKPLMASTSQSALKPLCKVFPTKREKRYNKFKPSMQWQLCQQMQCTTFQLFTKLLKYSHNKVQICCKSFIFHFPHTHIICSVHVGAMAKKKATRQIKVSTKQS